MPTNDYSKNIVYLSKEQYQELITNETLTVNGQTITYNDNDIYVTPQAEPITDVKINGTSIGSNGVADIPYATNNNLGLIQGAESKGITITNGSPFIRTAPDAVIKEGDYGYLPITPVNQHKSIFYGLSKLAGVDLANETVTLGIYPDTSKAAIQNMLGVTDLISTEESSPATTAHTLNSTFMMNGKLHRATAAIAVGDAVTEGENCEVVSVSDAFAAKKDTVLETTLSRGRAENSIIGERSFAFGNAVIASGANAHAEGKNTNATNSNTHAEGYGTVASGKMAHAEGQQTLAAGNCSHVEGIFSHANGQLSHAEGYYTIANGEAQHVFGKYNIGDSYDNWPEWTPSTNYNIGDKVKITTIQNNETNITAIQCKEANSDSSFDSNKWMYITGLMNYVETIGNGTADNSRSNARTLDWSGNERLNGYLYVGCNADSTGGVRVPHDVQVNGASIVSNGVANIPIATDTTPGVIKVKDTLGFTVSNGYIMTMGANLDNIKIGTNGNKTLTPLHQHEATFYGLAKAAGDSTQSISTNAVGTYTDEAKSAIQTMLGVPGDVQVNGTSIVSNGIANIPVATGSIFGVVRPHDNSFEYYQGSLRPKAASASDIKEGINGWKTIHPSGVKATAFYGLAQAAGDTTQSASSNAIGTYTAEAKAAIHTMLGIDPTSIAAQVDIPLVETVEGTTPSITGQPNVRYVCGEVSTITLTPPASGSMDVIFESGSTAAVLTVPNTVKWPAWFDVTALETDTTYEILITDGVYGSVMTWAN